MKDLTPEQIKDLEKRFSYQPPKGDQVERYLALRSKVKELAYLICQTTPVSKEQSTALTLLTQTSMMANAAIAINE